MKKLERRVNQVNGTHTIRFDELFPPDFMIRFTHFSSIDEMLEKSGFRIESKVDFEAIPNEDWERFISSNTQFATWVDMQAAAGSELIARKFEQTK